MTLLLEELVASIERSQVFFLRGIADDAVCRRTSWDAAPAIPPVIFFDRKPRVAGDMAFLGAGQGAGRTAIRVSTILR